MDGGPPPEGPGDRGPSRRAVLAAAAAVGAGATLAGCSEVANQKFEASPVTLGGDVETEFGLREVAVDSRSVERELGDASATVVSHAAIYKRPFAESGSDG